MIYWGHPIILIEVLMSPDFGFARICVVSLLNNRSLISLALFHFLYSWSFVYSLNSGKIRNPVMASFCPVCPNRRRHRRRQHNHTWLRRQETPHRRLFSSIPGHCPSKSEILLHQIPSPAPDCRECRPGRCPPHSSVPGFFPRARCGRR